MSVKSVGSVQQNILFVTASQTTQNNTARSGSVEKGLDADLLQGELYPLLLIITPNPTPHGDITNSIESDIDIT